MINAVKTDCLATDIADQLVKQGIPFRKAYSIIANGFDSSGLDIKRFGSHVENIKIPTPEESVEARNSKGGTSKRTVLELIKNATK